MEVPSPPPTHASHPRLDVSVRRQAGSGYHVQSAINVNGRPIVIDSRWFKRVEEGKVTAFVMDAVTNFFYHVDAVEQSLFPEHA